MAHEIEADFQYDYYNEEKQCHRCSSFKRESDKEGFCNEAKAVVPSNAHCDFFQSID